MDAAPTSLLSEDERRRIIVGVLIAMLLAALDQTIVAPAVPTIGAALGDLDFLPWIVSAYFLTATAVTPLYGKLADIHGRRPVLFTGIGIFVAGSVICALAPTLLALVLGRAIQGLGGGGLIALAQTVIGDIVPPRERGRYTAYISTIWATASVGGPIVGGFFAQHLHWSLIFWLNLPLALLAVLMTNRILQRLPQRRRNHRLDFTGAVLIIAATVCLMLMLTWAGTRYSWSSAEILGLGAAFAVFAAAFAGRLLSAREPLVPLSVLREPVIALATLSIFFAMGAYMGLSVYIPLYLELVHGFGSSDAGLALVVFLGAGVVGANLVGRAMLSVVHYKRLAVIGVAVAALAMAALALVADRASVYAVEVLLGVIGAGLGTQFPVTTVSVQNAAAPGDLGGATGMLAFLRSLGSARSVSVLGAILLASGIVGNLAESGGANGAPVSPQIAAASGHAFAWVFGAGAASLFLSVLCLLFMEEKPLRGHVAVAAES
ncbi:MAG: MFS transporter [Methylobacteriaceae bacterium]|nr:MFS transporter [Methylobacteriaceae bacterium]